MPYYKKINNVQLRFGSGTVSGYNKNLEFPGLVTFVEV